MPNFKSSIGNPARPSLDDICTLLTVTSTTDEIGQQILETTPTLVFCSKLSITRAEFNAAGGQGFKPAMMLVVDSESFDDQKLIDYEKQRYKIYKTFQRIDGHTELYCEVTNNDKY